MVKLRYFQNVKLFNKKVKVEMMNNAIVFSHIAAPLKKQNPPIVVELKDHTFAKHESYWS